VTLCRSHVVFSAASFGWNRDLSSFRIDLFRLFTPGTPLLTALLPRYRADHQKIAPDAGAGWAAEADERASKRISEA